MTGHVGVYVDMCVSNLWIASCQYMCMIRYSDTCEDLVEVPMALISALSSMRCYFACIFFVGCSNSKQLSLFPVQF